MIFIGLALGMSTGCDEFLNPEQIDLVYNDIFWESQTDAETGLAGCYALYRGLMVSGRNWYSRADATTGLIKKGWNGGSDSNLYSVGEYGDVNSIYKMWGSEGLQDYGNWENFYKVVSQCNMVIDKVSEMDDSAFDPGEKKRILGEAYFLRGLVYFNILRIWGNAPYIDEMIESSSQVIDEEKRPILIGRTDDVVIGMNVLSDARRASRMLAYKTPVTPGWGIRANKGSAQALIGHAALWMHFLAGRDGIDGQEVYVEEAIGALDSLSRYGNFSYVDYTDSVAVRNMYDGASTEAVFELHISSQDNESYRADASGVTALTCKMTPFDGDITKSRATQIDWVPFSEKKNFFPEYNFTPMCECEKHPCEHNGDIRPHLFFDAWDSTYEDPVNDLVGAASSDRRLVTSLKKYAIFAEDTYRDWDEYVAYFAEANIPVFRYTDARLLLAEAYCKSGRYAEAKSIVDEIRSRAKIGPYAGSDADLIYEVLQQRVSELFGEGHIYFDMVRNNWWIKPQLMSSVNYSQEAYYWPVSAEILQTNVEIDQTPYWSGKTRW